MKVIILAAGKGKRISKDIQEKPKSLLRINGKSIIENMVNILSRLECKIIVCTGYKHSLIEDELLGYDVKYYYNPFYEGCNNIGTVWMARDEFDGKDDVMIISADLMLEKKLLQRVMKEVTDGIIMFGDKSRIDDGDYFLRVENNKIIEYGAELERSIRDYEYVGISLVKAAMARVVKDRLSEMIDKGMIHEYYEKVLFSFIGDRNRAPRCVDLSGLIWHEIDRIEDYYMTKEKFEKEVF